MRSTPAGAVIEIIDKSRTLDGSAPSCVVPNEIRLNGQALLALADDPVVIHEMKVRADTLVTVTLTLLARRVLIGTESDIHAQPTLYGEGYFFAGLDSSNQEFPVKIQRRTALDQAGVVLDTYGVSVEHAEKFIAELQTAVAQARENSGA